MQVGSVSTPFGRRSMTYGMLSDQIALQDIDDDASVDKWKLYRALCEARPLLGITDRALSLLNALLSFFPKNELKANDNLVVFPSNAQLSLRAHGMAEPTIRRHIASLVAAGLIIRKDSANGKRFARRAQDGSLGDAFGFSLAPLLARSVEIAHLAAEIQAQRLELHSVKERITICRRDIAKLIEVGLESALDINWQAFSDRYQAIMATAQRDQSIEAARRRLEALNDLRDAIVNALNLHRETQNKNGNPSHSERHKQNSNTDHPNESEPAFEKDRGGSAEPMEIHVTPIAGKVVDEMTRHFPLGMVLSACPGIIDYGVGGRIGNWRDLMAAAIVVRSMLGISPSAYEEACAVLGQENAATVIACMLERSGHINSAGGYLRDLTRRAERGEFSIGPMLMALVRTNGTPGARRA